MWIYICIFIYTYTVINTHKCVCIYIYIYIIMYGRGIMLASYGDPWHDEPRIEQTRPHWTGSVRQECPSSYYCYNEFMFLYFEDLHIANWMKYGYLYHPTSGIAAAAASPAPPLLHPGRPIDSRFVEVAVERSPLGRFVRFNRKLGSGSHKTVYLGAGPKIQRQPK